MLWSFVSSMTHFRWDLLLTNLHAQIVAKKSQISGTYIVTFTPIRSIWLPALKLFYLIF